jgi:hypothetical protein
LVNYHVLKGRIGDAAGEASALFNMGSIDMEKDDFDKAKLG